MEEGREGNPWATTTHPPSAPIESGGCCIFDKTTLFPFQATHLPSNETEFPPSREGITWASAGAPAGSGRRRSG